MGGRRKPRRRDRVAAHLVACAEQRRNRRYVHFGPLRILAEPGADDQPVAQPTPDDADQPVAQPTPDDAQ